MSIVINQPRYTPVGVSPLALIKPTAPADQPGATDLFNAELQAIADAFASISSLPLASTSPVNLSATSRNVLIDLTSKVNTDASIIINLPESPAPGDPPCVIEIQKDGYHTSGTHLEAAAVLTTTSRDGSMINGAVPDNAVGLNRVALYGQGDRAVCIFLGADIGWRTYLLIRTVVNPHQPLTLPASAGFPGPWQKSIVDVTTTAAYALDGITLIGQWFQMTNAGAGGVITLGDSTYTFNGVAGPYLISDQYVAHRFVLTAALTFEVT
jgi:hypothetical protein